MSQYVGFNMAAKFSIMEHVHWYLASLFSAEKKMKKEISVRVKDEHYLTEIF